MWPSLGLVVWPLGVVSLLRLRQTQLSGLRSLRLGLQVCDKGPQSLRHEMESDNCPPAAGFSHMQIMRPPQGCSLTGWGTGVHQHNRGRRTCHLGQTLFGSFFSVANESLIRDTETLSQQYLIGTAPLMRVFGSRPRTGTSLATEEM